MTKVVIYTQSNCRQSEKAKLIILSKSINFLEKDITYDMLLRREMRERTGGKVITPQIFIDEKYIGSYEELSKLESKGKLDKLVG
jgi:glutaredoxin 3